MRLESDTPAPMHLMNASLVEMGEINVGKVVVEGGPGKTGRRGVRQETSPSLWRTKEFYLYYAVFLVMVPYMCKAVIDISKPSHPNFPLYQHRLDQGWIFGRLVDDSDAQYHEFRSNFFTLSGAALGHLLYSTCWNAEPVRRRSPFKARHQQCGIVIFGLLVISVLYGTSMIKILVILAANYSIAKRLGGSRLAPWATWLFNLAILFANERYQGYSFRFIGLRFLDNFHGLSPRWYIHFNITMLRLISFNMDHYWSLRSDKPSATNGKETVSLDDKDRSRNARSSEEYDASSYLAYVLYPPLLIAGPILTFNAFSSQLETPVKLSRRETFVYALRFMACMLCMEAILHYMYVVAIKDERAWTGLSMMQLSMLGFWNLIVVWLKLLLPWRFFRLWAKCDGMETPENMGRCMANNYSALGFWRAWHRSYNLWTIRYIYIPLGGSKNAIPSTLLVFTFVALWHDLSLHLLTWGWLIVLFILPELAATKLLPPSRYPGRTWYRHVCAIGGVFNVLTMMAANLIGFALGIEGTVYMYEMLLGSLHGLQFMLGACATLFVGVQVMFELRESEKRRGVEKRY